MIKNNIEKIRSKKGYSIRKLAMKTGMSKSMIFRLENSQTSLDLKRLEKLAIALDCRITDLFDSEYKQCFGEWDLLTITHKIVL